jgi:hypothetical protein
VDEYLADVLGGLCWYVGMNSIYDHNQSQVAQYKHENIYRGIQDWAYCSSSASAALLVRCLLLGLGPSSLSGF